MIPSSTGRIRLDGDLKPGEGTSTHPWVPGSEKYDDKAAPLLAGKSWCRTDAKDSEAAQQGSRMHANTAAKSMLCTCTHRTRARPVHVERPDGHARLAGVNTAATEIGERGIDLRGDLRVRGGVEAHLDVLGDGSALVI